MAKHILLALGLTFAFFIPAVVLFNAGEACLATLIVLVPVAYFAALWISNKGKLRSG